jgi:long-subunit acyl-CoA synthetase (AMP-forming)
VRPTYFFAVPRVWEKMKAALEAGFEVEQSETRKKAVESALGVGRRQAEVRESDRKVLAGVRERIGLDRLVAANVGAAPTPPEVIEFFRALGIPLAELWGLSESCAMGACNPPERVRIGTVGPPLPGLELKLAGDGEVLLRGEMVMRGYRNKPEATAEAIDADGWLHTGDVGQLDEDGYLMIVDRKKELIINATGKNMSPANIEAVVKCSGPLIGQACVVGDGRPYNVALIVLDPDAADVFARQHRITAGTPEALVEEVAVLREVADSIERANAKLARVEQIKRFRLLPGEWQPGGEELTPTSKLRRRPIERRYAAEIEGLYAD